MSLLRAIIRFLTFYNWRKARYVKMRRARYEELKAQISARHFGGYAGLVVEDKKYDRIDMACFQHPMYVVVQNQDLKYCIFWDRPRMAKEIGTGAPLKEGELMIPETGVRSKPSSTLETIDEQKPLTRQKVVDDDDLDDPADESGEV